MRHYDISPMIEENLAVFPGDQSYRRSISLDFSKGDHLGLSSIQTTLHIGAHADAPCHYGAKGEGIASRDLELYFGPAQVIRIDGKPARILPEHLNVSIQAPRLLFFTGSFPDPRLWNDDFTALSPELIEWGSAQGVRLFGIDTPSVDPAASKALESHQALLKTNSAVLEGVVLDRVPEGLYWLSALPLKLKDADASPVRAVLWDTKDLPTF
jgi:arylformamidase